LEAAIQSEGTTNLEQRISMAHDELDAFGHGGPALEAPAAVTDKMHALLVARTDELMSCTGGSPEEAELAALADAIGGYEAVRWPDGMIEGGKR
jgi:hypothetical protein